MFKVFRELIPIHFSFLAAPVEPFVNQFGRHPVKLHYFGGVSADAVILEVASQLRREGLPPFFCFKGLTFKLSASSIAGIYKQCWQIELFFKWVKQNLKIKSFLGTSENAVMKQVWIALTHYLIVAYLKFLHGFNIMLNMTLLEMLCLERQAIEKPPDWNRPDQPDIFPDFLF